MLCALAFSTCLSLTSLGSATDNKAKVSFVLESSQHEGRFTRRNTKSSTVVMLAGTQTGLDLARIYYDVTIYWVLIFLLLLFRIQTNEIIVRTDLNIVEIDSDVIIIVVACERSTKKVSVAQEYDEE